MVDRNLAWGLLVEFTPSESLRRHAMAVEACMRAYARKLGGDEEKWALTGLLHDFDYERHPTPEVAAEASDYIDGLPEEASTHHLVLKIIGEILDVRRS